MNTWVSFPNRKITGAHQQRTKQRMSYKKKKKNGNKNRGRESQKESEKAVSCKLQWKMSNAREMWTREKNAKAEMGIEQRVQSRKCENGGTVVRWVKKLRAETPMKKL